jgi:hypothetical protein
MTIDPPLVLVLDVGDGRRLARGAAGRKTRDWLVVGLAMGLGFLCKYTAVCQIVCWAIFFALWPAARAHLRKPGPWLALLIFLVCTTAGHHLECATRLDHRSSRRGNAGLDKPVAADAALLLGLSVCAKRAAEPDFLHRRAVGDARPFGNSAANVRCGFTFSAWARRFSRLLALVVSLADFAELDCARHPADVLPDGRVLG